jgi:apolipoprotein N-acyltransferase
MIFSKARLEYFSALPVFLCVAGLFFGFANPFFHFPPMFFLFLLGLNLISLNADSGRQVFTRSFLASGLAYSACLYWVVVPVNHYGGFPMALAVFCPLLLGFYVGLFASLYCLFVFYIKKSFAWFWLGIFGGCAWAGLELVREYALTGFPWFVSAQSFAVWPRTIQAVSVVGSFGLAMIMAAGLLWLSLGRARPAFLGASILSIVFGYGFFFQGQDYDFEDITVLTVQGNIDQTLKWEREIQLFTVRKYMDLTDEGIALQKPDLVIWPETALPFYFQEPTELADMVRQFARERSLNIITGSPAYRFEDDSHGYTLYNRAYWISSDGFIHDYYDKERLVPFGEYVPLSRYIPLLEKLVEGDLDFSPGTAISPLSKGDLALGVLICYEIIFPGLARKRVNQGADIIINLSNDAWFGNTSAPAQHLHLSVLRAVEQGRYVIRATNTGISAFIGPRGNVYNSSALFEDAAVLDRAGLITADSIYHHLHPVINFLLLAGVVSALFLHTFKMRRTGK